MKHQNDPTVFISRTSLNIDPNTLEGYICDYRIDEENNVLYYYSSVEGLSPITLTNHYLVEQTGQDFSVIETEMKENPEKIEEIICSLSNPLQRFKAECIAKNLPALI